MKILFVHEKGGFFGGVEQNIAETVIGLRDRGHSCYLAYGMESGRDTDRYMALFDGAYLCRELTADCQHPDADSFMAVLKTIGPDTVYFHKVADTGFFEPHFGTIHSVRMVHDHDLCCPRKHKYFATNGRVCHHPAGWRCWLDAAFLSRSPSSPFGIGWVSIPARLREMQRNYRFDRLLVGSRFMHQELVQNGFEENRITIIPPVVRPECKPAQPVPEAPNLLYVGQLIRGKGVDLLLQALKYVKCDYILKIIGTGNAESRLRNLCQELGLSRHVEFLGWVNHEELETHYAWSKILVVPSRWPEPFGMIGLEAMRQGRAVVGFQTGGIPDWLEHEVTGLLAPEQDVQALGQALEKLLIDTALAEKLGRNGADRAAKKFSYDGYLDQLESYLLPPN